VRRPEQAEPGVDVEARQAGEACLAGFAGERSTSGGAGRVAPASAIVGTSGIALERRAVVTASALSLPALMFADAVARCRS